MNDAPRKVAILGGGVGAMTAAFALTERAEDRARFDVTVYQMGWRLGGKGASGRNPAEGNRIEEHGLHVWSGFYDNAIAQMKACLAECQRIGEDGVYRDFDEAFTPHNTIALGDDRDGGWTVLPLVPPFNRAEPGGGRVPLSAWDYFQMLSRYVRETLHQRDDPLRAEPPARAVIASQTMAHIERREAAAGRQPDTPSTLHHLTAFAESLPGDPRALQPADTDALDALTREAETQVKGARDRQRREAAANAAGAAKAAEAAEAEETLFLSALELGAVVLRGMFADGVYWRGFDAIDGEEISAWLARHGASADVVDSPLVRAVYDYAFGFRRGITDRAFRAIAAGTFIQGTLRLMLTYKEAIFFKMNAGMGDTIFTPYYKALAARGVKFAFFHKVRALRLDAAKQSVTRIEIDRQATPRDGAYDPFVRVAGLDCWPSQPLYDQLLEGDALRARGVNLESSWSDWDPVGRTVLEQGTDFDAVICGISLGALPHVAGELIAADPAWQRMVSRVETCATQAMQLVLRSTVAELGWPHGNTILTAYADDMNTWADMTHLHPVETWPEDKTPGSIAYFCGPLADPEDLPGFADTGFPARAKAAVCEASRRWLDRHGPTIWPNAFDGAGKFRDDLLITGSEPADCDRFAAQYFRANYEPTERYVLSVPGSTTARLRSDRSGFRNLWLAGDWTYTGINAGCVEAAAMSGLRAAAGLAGRVPEIVGEETDPVPGGGRSARGPGVPEAPALISLRPQNARWPWSTAFGTAKLTGATVTLPFPRATVAALLPPGLALAGQDLTAPDHHPVSFLFARQRDVRPNLLPVGVDYAEFVCTIPWVRHAGNGASALPPLLCPAKLYLDNLGMTLFGDWAYGFPKTRATILVDADHFVVSDRRSGDPIISAAFPRAGARARAYEMPHFENVRRGYEMAMVTRNRLGMWQYSVFDFSLGQAELEPVDLQIRIMSDAIGLPQGTYSAASIDASPFGGVFLTADATISNPMQSFDLRRRLARLAR